IQYFASGQPVPIYLRGAFSQAYSLTCKDDHRIALHMSSPDKFWLILCKMVGREDWTKKFPTHLDRVRGYDEIAAELAKIFRTRLRDEWMAILETEGLPFAPEHEVQDVDSDPQIAHLGVFYEIEHPKFGKIRNAHRPSWVDHSRDIEFRPPPALGENNDELFKELGLSKDEINKLRARGRI
ncbi:MAG: CoA transferase, partial [Chthoniobacterales bacterium]